MAQERGPYRKPVVKEDHYRRMVEMYLRGKNQFEIAGELGIDRTTVSKDLKKIREMWKAQYLKDFDSAKSEVLARIDHLEQAAWVAWEKSVEDGEKKRQAIKTELVPAGENKTPIEVGREVVMLSDTVRQTGNIKYMQTIQWCIDKRMEILGLKTTTATFGRFQQSLKNAEGDIVESTATSILQLYMPDNHRDEPEPFEDPAVDVIE